MVKYSELVRTLNKEGWYIVRQSGGHMLMQHPEKNARLIIPFHGSKEVKKGLLRSILKQAGIKPGKR